MFAHDIFLFVVAYFAARKTTSFLYSLYRKMRFSVPSYSEDEHGCTCHKCGKDIVSRFAQYLSVKCCDCSMWQQVYSMEERDVTTPGFLVDKIESKEAVIQDGLHWVGFTDPKARDGKF